MILTNSMIKSTNYNNKRKIHKIRLCTKTAKRRKTKYISLEINWQNFKKNSKIKKLNMIINKQKFNG